MGGSTSASAESIVGTFKLSYPSIKMPVSMLALFSEIVPSGSDSIIPIFGDPSSFKATAKGD